MAPLLPQSVARPWGHRAKKNYGVYHFLGKTRQKVYAKGPERTVYTIEASNPKKKTGGCPRWWWVFSSSLLGPPPLENEIAPKSFKVQNETQYEKSEICPETSPTKFKPCSVVSYRHFFLMLHGQFQRHVFFSPPRICRHHHAKKIRAHTFYGSLTNRLQVCQSTFHSICYHTSCSRVTLLEMLISCT